MKFKKEPYPKIGDERIIRKFLLLPYRLDDEVRWLETASILQRREAEYDSSIYEYWQNISWED